MIMAHCSLELPSSRSSQPNPTAAGITGVCHHARLIFVFLVKTGFCHVGQAGVELLISGEPPALASQTARLTGVSHHAPPEVFYTGNSARSLDCRKTVWQQV